jgi:hypothetical protein
VKWSLNGSKGTDDDEDDDEEEESDVKDVSFLRQEIIVFIQRAAKVSRFALAGREGGFGGIGEESLLLGSYSMRRAVISAKREVAVFALRARSAATRLAPVGKVERLGLLSSLIV